MLCSLAGEASFGPDEIRRMAEAYEMALRKTHIERTDPLTEFVAGKIIEFVHQGEREPALICAKALQSLNGQL